jgi:hypothetical protein
MLDFTSIHKKTSHVVLPDFQVNANKSAKHVHTDIKRSNR